MIFFLVQDTSTTKVKPKKFQSLKSIHPFSFPLIRGRAAVTAGLAGCSTAADRGNSPEEQRDFNASITTQSWWP